MIKLKGEAYGMFTTIVTMHIIGGGGINEETVVFIPR